MRFAQAVEIYTDTLLTLVGHIKRAFLAALCAMYKLMSKRNQFFLLVSCSPAMSRVLSHPGI